MGYSGMIERIGKVLRISGDKAFIQFRLSCADDCVCCPMGRLFGGKSQDLCEMEAVNQAGAGPGDTVRAEITPGAQLSAYSLAYGVPLVGFIIGAISGALLARSLHRYETLFTGLFGLLGLAAGFGVALRKGRHFGTQVVITGVIQKAL